jgi:hypothetical protein
MQRVREKRGRPLLGVDGEVCAKRIQKGLKKMKKGLDRVSIVRDYGVYQDYRLFTTVASPRC